MQLITAYHIPRIFLSLQQVKLSFVNTLCALSIATCYVFMGSFPKTLRSMAHFNFQETEESSAAHKILAEILSSPKPTPPFFPYHVLRRFSRQDRTPSFKEEKIFRAIFPSHQSQESPKVEPFQQKTVNFVECPEFVFLSMSSSSIFNSPLSQPPSSGVVPLAKQTLDEQVYSNESTDLLTTMTGENVRSPRVGRRASQILPRVESDSETIPTDVLSSPESVPSPRKNDLKPWNTYLVESNDPFLRLCLMKLAPGIRTLIAAADIPFRKALIETLLSSEFQPYVSRTWEKDKSMKDIREAFCDKYMRSVEWNQTRHGKLFLTPAEDIHLVNEEAYLEAFYFPLKLGLKLYKEEDFCVK